MTIFSWLSFCKIDLPINSRLFSPRSFSRFTLDCISIYLLAFLTLFYYLSEPEPEVYYIYFRSLSYLDKCFIP